MNPFAAIIGAIYPPQKMAEKIVRDVLSKCEMPPAEYPIVELAAHSVSLAKFQGKMTQQWYRTVLYDTTSGIAHGAVFITAGESEWTAKKIRMDVERGSPNIVWEILAKHNPERFSLDNLEQTQSQFRRSKVSGS